MVSPFKALQLPCGHTVLQDIYGVNAHRWVTSGGNVAHIWWGNGQALWVCNERRHAVNGMCQPIDLADCDVLQLLSARPDGVWYETCE